MKDIDIRFKLHPMTGDLIIKRDEESIKQSIRNILMFSSLERRDNPHFGVGINQMLFSNFSMFEIQFLKMRISNNLFNYEKRIDVIDVEIVSIPEANQAIITIYYQYKGSKGQVKSFSSSIHQGFIINE